jgi:hypothetical protein
LGRFASRWSLSVPVFGASPKGAVVSIVVIAEPVTTLPPEYRAPIMDRMRASGGHLRRMIETCVAACSISPCEPWLAVSFFRGAINHIARWYSVDGPMTGRQIGEAFADFILNGLRGAAK